MPYLNNIKLWLLWPIACLIMLAGGGCSDKKTDQLDTSLLGIWRTNAPKYVDRYIEISGNLLILGAGDHDPGIYYIKKIQKNLDIYDLSCTGTDESEYIFELHVDSQSEDPTLKLKNQRQVLWHKAGSSFSGPK